MSNLSPIKTDFNAKPNLEYVTIKGNEYKDYTAVLEMLKQKKFEYFSYHVKAQKSVKIVIKYVPTDYIIEKVKDELINLKLSFIKANFMKGQGNRLLPIVQIHT